MDGRKRRCPISSPAPALPLSSETANGRSGRIQIFKIGTTKSWFRFNRACVKWFTHLFKRSSRVNFALLAHRYNLLVPMHFFCLIVTFDRSISEESNSKGLFKETEKKNWNVTTKPMCKLYWIASAPARKPYRIGYELWFWRVFCDEAPRRSLKGRVTYIGKKFILKRIDFRAASKWMWIEFAHVQLYANLQGSVTIYGIS